MLGSRVRWGLMVLAVLSGLSLSFPAGQVAGPQQARVVTEDLRRPEVPPWIHRATRQVLVLGHAGSESLMEKILWPASDAVLAVGDFWSTAGAWQQHATIVVPSTEDELRALLAEDGELGRTAAVTDPEGRVVINPEVFGTLSPRGRQVVLTHEITHVAARQLTSVVTPFWLGEGLADYVAYRRSAVRDRSIAKELADEVRAGRLPAQLPARRDFRAENPRQAQAYQEAWLAARFIVERAGEDALIRVYRKMSAGTDINVVFRAELGLTEQGFVAHWREYVEGHLR